MIGFVLDDPRRVIVGASARCARRRGRSARTLISRARGTRPRMSGMLRQPSQSSSTMSVPTGDDFRVDDRDRRRRPSRRPRRASSAGDEQPQPFVDLRRRQADAVILDHRLDHVVDQLLDDRVADVGALEGARLRAQHRMAHARDLQDRHIRRIILVSACDEAASCTPTTNRTPTASARAAASALERRLLKAERARAARLRRVRLRVLSRSEDRRRHDHPVAADRHRAGPARHRARLRQVGVPGRLRRSRRDR